MSREDLDAAFRRFEQAMKSGPAREAPAPASRPARAGTPSHVVILTTDDVAWVKAEGRRRYQTSRSRGRQHRFGWQGTEADNLEMDTLGVAGEVAVCKLYGLPLEPLQGSYQHGAGDVEGWEVRTAATAGLCLLLHEDSVDDRAHILVTGPIPNMVVHGWVLGRDGKLPAYWTDKGNGRPAYFVPQRVLRPMDELRTVPQLEQTAVDEAVESQRLQAEEARQRSLADPGVPPAYKGRTWSQPTPNGVIQSPYPPIRPDGHEVGDEFLEFRAHHVATMAARHPEYFCASCRAWSVSRTGNICGHCQIRNRRREGIPSGYDESKANRGPDGRRAPGGKNQPTGAAPGAGGAAASPAVQLRLGGYEENPADSGMPYPD